MQGSRFKIAAVRPDQRMHFRIDSDLIEKSDVMERAKQFSRQYRLEVDHFFAAVIKSNFQRIGRNNLKRLDAVISVHVLSLLEEMCRNKPQSGEMFIGRPLLSPSSFRL